MTKTMIILSFLANSSLVRHDCFKLVEIMNVDNLLIGNKLVKMVIFESEVRNVGYKTRANRLGRELNHARP